MKLSAVFVSLALASLSMANPIEIRDDKSVSKRHGPGKRGLAWPWYNKSLDPGRLNDGQGTVNLIYDWETSSPSSSNGNGGLAFIGMQRCKDCTSSPINQLAARQQQLGFVTVFTLNEPDFPGTGYVSPSDAAGWYKQYINPLAIKKALPAVTSSATAGQGLDWVQQMINACAGGCFYDYINLHWYGQNFQQFQTYINAAHAKFPNNKIVVSEFALANPPGGQADQLNFFRQAFAFLDAATFVEMYFPFAATSPALFNANDANPGAIGTSSMLYNNDGTISAVGQLLLSA